MISIFLGEGEKEYGDSFVIMELEENFKQRNIEVLWFDTFEDIKIGTGVCGDNEIVLIYRVR